MALLKEAAATWERVRRRLDGNKGETDDEKPYREQARVRRKREIHAETTAVPTSSSESSFACGVDPELGRGCNPCLSSQGFGEVSTSADGRRKVQRSMNMRTSPCPIPVNIFNSPTMGFVTGLQDQQGRWLLSQDQSGWHLSTASSLQTLACFLFLVIGIATVSSYILSFARMLTSVFILPGKSVCLTP